MLFGPFLVGGTPRLARIRASLLVVLVAAVLHAVPAECSLGDDDVVNVDARGALFQDPEASAESVGPSFGAGRCNSAKTGQRIA
jgi:hypothetical protein